MTRKTNTAHTETAAYFDQFRQAFEGLYGKMDVPAAARDFAQRGAVSARERAEQAHLGVRDAVASAEKLTETVVGHSVSAARDVVEAGFANLRHALTTAEKLAGANSVGETFEIQAEFLRENAKANVERVRAAGEAAGKAAADSAAELRAGMAKFAA
ncbi:phasin family protein [Nitratireductor sp. StC3]|uniref:phasin family protein n=1 Tax=Nitratireductor sp. StC3 TaxID=2126741 RepID=UPI001304B7C9|nr:phasin family protein [Nitratireductor sp. StC3]